MKSINYTKGFKQGFFVCLFFGFYWPHRAAGRILAPLPGIEPAPPQWKYRVLTTGSPGKSKQVKKIEEGEINHLFILYIFIENLLCIKVLGIH